MMGKATVLQMMGKVTVALDDGESNSTSDDGESNSALDDGESNSASDDGESNSALDDGESNSTSDDGESNSALDEGESNSTSHDGESNSTSDDGESNSALDDGESNRTSGQLHSLLSIPCAGPALVLGTKVQPELQGASPACPHLSLSPTLTQPQECQTPAIQSRGSDQVRHFTKMLPTCPEHGLAPPPPEGLGGYLLHSRQESHKRFLCR
ncbi:hypothetical protein P7K49_023612 [Saguinus oedipus]|uniref:Uncharacterized protein n=1 Tax=Saguinus oedipus TaxID=9490 RepID=A0ABQ9UM61_SAGOE|nr:hypothetical protein P7K49_023612 [Saguinus oedipus]